MAISDRMSEQKKLVINNLRQQERLVLQRNAELVSELKRIPHLPLQLIFDTQTLLKEAKQIQEFRSHELHQTKQLPQWYYEHHKNSFRGQCLVDYKSDGDQGMQDAEGHLFEEPDAKFDSQNRLKFFDTVWGHKMPESLKTFRQMTPYLNRTRLISTPPGGGIHWHSHHNNVYQNSYLRLAVIILTLETNDESIHGVRDYREENGPTYFQKYKPGVAYLFNSWHNHDFWNRGKSNRLTLISYMNFPDENLLKFLESSVSQYTGPRLEVDKR